jgi:HlyD family secretion protein
MMPSWSRSILAGVAALLAVSAASAAEDRIAALGRIEPQGGVLRVSGPSGGPSVIAKLFVDEGDRVEEGQRIAILDSHARSRAELLRAEAELEEAKRELGRTRSLAVGGATSDARRDSAELAEKIATADLEAARAALELSIVRAPIGGQVLEIHTRSGERVDSRGVVELGKTDAMYAIAEVYETDVRRVSVGDSATVRSPALVEPLRGRVERIGLKIGKADVLDTDPAAKADARVVEVDIKLDESEIVAGLTNLQVEVLIEP